MSEDAAQPVAGILKLREALLERPGVACRDPHHAAVLAGSVGVLDRALSLLHDVNAWWDLVVDQHRQAKVTRREGTRHRLKVLTDAIACLDLARVIHLLMNRPSVVRKEEVMHRPLVRDTGHLIVAMVNLSAMGV